MSDEAGLGYVHGGDLGATQMWDATDSMRQELNQQISSLESTLTANIEATATYTPTRAADWASPAPTTVQSAFDRLAYHLSSGAGAVPIVQVP